MIELAPPEYLKRMTLRDAVLYCQFLEIDGKRDWRFPTLNEVKTCKHIASMQDAIWLDGDLELVDNSLRGGSGGKAMDFTFGVVPVRTRNDNESF